MPCIRFLSNAMYWIPIRCHVLDSYPMLCIRFLSNACFCLATNKLFIHTTWDEARVGFQEKKGARLPCKERPAILTKPGALGVNPQYR